MTAKPLQISWNNLSGGINDQIWQGQSGRYYRGYGFDTLRFDTRPVRAPALINTYSDGVNAIFNEEKITGNSGYNILWTNDGKIYENTTLRATIAGTAKQGYNIAAMKPFGGTDYKLYYFHYTIPSINPKYIHRSDIGGTSFEENKFSYTNSDGNPNYTPPIQPNGMVVKEEGNRILFSYYNSIYEITNLEVINLLISFPSEQNVVGITEFQGSYKIYTTAGFATSKIYTWDGTDSLPTSSVNLKGIAIIKGVQNLGAYDYFMSDDGLYQVAGVQYQRIYNITNGRIVLAYDDKLVLELVDPLNNKYLGEYETKPGYTRGITPKYIIDLANQSSGEIKAIDYNSNGLVFSSLTKLFYSYGIPYGQNGTINYYIESLTFVGDNIQYRKDINEIIFKFSGLTTQNIELYADINNSVFIDSNNSNWIKIWEGNNNTPLSTNMGVRIYKNNFLNPLGKFNTIRFKVVIPFTVASASTQGAQGRFYGLDIFGNQDIGL